MEFDCNPLAVELAKLSLWLATAQPDQPLSFLNHHLRQGNSLTGAWLSELVSTSKSSKQLDLMQGTLTKLSDNWRRDIASIESLLSIDRSTIARQQSLLKALDEAEASVRTALDTVSVRRFDIGSANDTESAILEALDIAAGPARRIEHQEEPSEALLPVDRPLHWELAFPQVMIGADCGFDAVIMNPPWISAWEMTNTHPALRNALKKAAWAVPVLKRHWDLFVPFVWLACTKLLRPGGRLGVVLPNPVQREKYAEQLRSGLLDGRFELIVDFGASNMFAEVSRESVVYVWRRKVPSDDWTARVEVVTPDRTTILTIPQQVWRNAPEHRIQYDLTPRVLAWLSAIRSRSLPLRDICYVSYGAQLSSKEKGGFKRATFLALTERNMQNPKHFVEGSDMEPFAAHWRGRWVDWRPDEIYGARFPELFTSPKLLIRHISGDQDRIVAAFDPAIRPTDALYTDHGVILAVPFRHLRHLRQGAAEDHSDAVAHFDPWYLLGCLSSRLVSRYYALMYATGSLQGDFSHVYPAAAKQLPIAETPSVDRTGAPSPALLLELFGMAPSDAEGRRLLMQAGVAPGPIAAGAIANSAERIAARTHELAQAGTDFAAWFAARFGAPWHGAVGAALADGVSDADVLADLPSDTGVAEFTEVRDEVARAVSTARALAEERDVLRSALDLLVQIQYDTAEVP